MASTRRVLGFLAVALSLAAVASAQPARREFAGVTNFVQVEPRVATSGRVAIDAFPRLKEDGFTAVIALIQEDEQNADVAGERKAAAAAGLKYVHTPFNGADPKADSAEAFLKAAAAARDEKILIHCMSGNRVGALWLIKRVVQDGWPVEKATAEADAIGLTRPALKQFALDYLKSQAR